MSKIERGLMVRVAEFKPHPMNYNAHPQNQVEALRESLGIFGQVRDVVVWREFIIAGHGVVEAAKAEGWTEIHATRLPDDWDEERVLAYLATDNETARMSEPDNAQLATLLEVISDDSLRVLAAGGAEHMRELLQWAREKPEDPGPQEVTPELIAKWGVETGQIWEIGHHRLACGDSTDAQLVRALWGDLTPWMCLTSPPYWVGKSYEKNTSFEEHLALLTKMYQMAYRIIDTAGFLFVNFGDIASQSMTRRLTGVEGQCIYPISMDHYRIGREAGWALYAARVWLKPFNRLQRPFWTYRTSIPHHQEYEWLWTWVKNGECSDDFGNLPDDWCYAWTWRKAGTGAKDRHYDWKISSRAVWDTRQEAVADKPLTRHIAAFPVGIPERALRAHSAVGALVWEPFCGSGTTIVACENLGRICRAAELSPQYCTSTLERFSIMGLEPRLVE